MKKAAILLCCAFSVNAWEKLPGYPETVLASQGTKIGIKWSDERKELHKLYVKRGENHPGKRGLSKEHKLKLSISGKGKHIGFKHTEESKRNMSASKTGNKNPMFGKN